MRYPHETSINQLCIALGSPDTLNELRTLEVLQRYVWAKAHILVNPHPKNDIRRWVWKPMKHPDMLVLHQSRVSIFAQKLWVSLRLQSLNFGYIAILGAHHDSPEFVSPFWDVITPVKHALTWSNLETFNLIEDIIERMTEDVLGLQEWFYKEYRGMVLAEHDLIKLADMLDAYFTAIMEVQLWNNELVEKLNWVSHGRLSKLAENKLLYNIDFSTYAPELIQFARDIHTKNPPALYTLWRKVHKEVQDDIARRVWTWELDEYPDTVMSPIVSHT